MIWWNAHLPLGFCWVYRLGLEDQGQGLGVELSDLVAGLPADPQTSRNSILFPGPLFRIPCLCEGVCVRAAASQLLLRSCVRELVWHQNAEMQKPPKASCMQ